MRRWRFWGCWITPITYKLSQPRKVSGGLMRTVKAVPTATLRVSAVPRLVVAYQLLVNRCLNWQRRLASRPLGRWLSGSGNDSSVSRLALCQYWVRCLSCSLWAGLRCIQALSSTSSVGAGTRSLSSRTSQSAACCLISSAGVSLWILSMPLLCPFIALFVVVFTVGALIYKVSAVSYAFGHMFFDGTDGDTQLH